MFPFPCSESGMASWQLTSVPQLMVNAQLVTTVFNDNRLAHCPTVGVNT